MTTAPVLLDASAVWRVGSPTHPATWRSTVRVLDLDYDADFERLAAHTDLAVAVQALAPLGSLP